MRVQDIILSSIHETLNPIAWVIGIMALVMWIIVLVNLLPEMVAMFLSYATYVSIGG